MTERQTRDTPYNVLFLCTGNSARSIMAEAILGRFGAGKFKAYSAGSQPKGEIHPRVLHMLKNFNYKSENYRSKSWEEFSGPGAPEFDFVFTVCDNAAREVCPVWPGQPMSAHWGVPDPAVAGNGGRDRVRVRRRLAHAAEPHHHLLQSADRRARSSNAPEEAERHRQDARRRRRNGCLKLSRGRAWRLAWGGAFSLRR